MDLKNKALLEAFNQKYGGIKSEPGDLERFAKKYYGQDVSAPRREGPSLMERAKETVNKVSQINAARRSGDISKIKKAYEDKNYRGF